MEEAEADAAEAMPPVPEEPSPPPEPKEPKEEKEEKEEKTEAWYIFGKMEWEVDEILREITRICRIQIVYKLLFLFFLCASIHIYTMRLL